MKPPDIPSSFSEEQVSLINLELDALKNGTHPEFLQRLAENERVRELQSKIITNVYNFQVKNVESFFETERKEANDTFEVRCIYGISDGLSV